MSWLPSATPEQDACECPAAVDLVIVPRSAELGDFGIRRVLPFRGRRTVGPFVFWDQMGPAVFPVGRGLDVLPHPHIGLATITYLTEGAIDHRDSLGSHQRIEPGAVNLMTAGSGIVHSERTRPEDRLESSPLAGIQSWIALPAAIERCEPAFHHAPGASLPIVSDGGHRVRILAGSVDGTRSPLEVPGHAVYLDVHLAAGARFPIAADLAEDRAVYLLDGEVTVNGVGYERYRMLVLKPGAVAIVTALTAARVMVLGGDVRTDPTFIWWNFVASSRERIEEAQTMWRDGRFAVVPGDELARAPLPSS